ncbi:hypothetical protein [Clostridium sp. HMP27]|uniref:hypothetical protein n=1 Tax=Clostridium sp. HMP27 TaxID=1487921 RepID=UPI00052CDC83|nr:hypothetical protein [Clostridium sp. HMP27]KGK86569.1 hypothetical protein DP68_13250 [Clostridium sp. HMP27]
MKQEDLHYEGFFNEKVEEILTKCSGVKKDILEEFWKSTNEKVNTDSKKVFLDRPKLDKQNNRLTFFLYYKDIIMLKVYLEDRENNNIDISLSWKRVAMNVTNTGMKNIPDLLEEHNIHTEKLKEIIKNVFHGYDYEINVATEKNKANTSYNKQEDKMTSDIEDFVIKTIYIDRDKLVKCLLELTDKLTAIVDLLT